MTPKQAVVLQAVKDLIDGDVTPTYREIAAKAGIAVGNAHRTVQQLIKRKRLVATPDCARSIWPVDSFDDDALDAMSRPQLWALLREVQERLER